jgi:hypothetical protein
MADEGAQKLELERRQGDGFPRNRHLALGEVDRHEPVGVRARLLLARPRTAQMRLDSREQLLAAERLGHVIVRPRL